jgi:hypothetical protein
MSTPYMYTSAAAPTVGPVDARCPREPVRGFLPWHVRVTC